MKRKSDLVKHQLPKNFPHNDSEFDYVRREAKRNYTTFRLPPQEFMLQLTQTLTKNQWRHSQTIATGLVHNLIDSLQHWIEKIETKKMINSAICLTNSIASQLINLQDPQKSFNQIAPQPESEPCKNITDPISGFNKQNFIKKPSFKHKYSCEASLSSFKDSSQITNQPSNRQKKLPPLMKQLSQQKLQVFIPLEDNINGLRKKSSLDFEELVRDRLLKEIENRKFKEKIEAMSAGVQISQTNKKINSKSTHAQNKSIPKEDCNFDYDGNKISIFSLGKVKSNLKILKALYKIPKQRPEQKGAKLQKKFHQRISYVPRASRNYLQINNKTISDFGDLNYSIALKEKLQIQLRKTDIKFVEKQYYGKEREKRESIVP